MYAALVLWVGLSCALAVEVTVVKPTSEGQTDVGLVMIPGNGISGRQYMPLVDAIQKETNQNVFTALTDGYTEGIVDETEVLEAVNKSVAALLAAGLDKNAAIMVAGHGNGGRVLVNLIDEELPMVEGLILMGTPLHDGEINFFVKPVMTIVGELDGITTVFQVAPQWKALEEDSDVLDPLIFDYPVVITPGGNHAMFIGGDLPSDQAEQDIETEQDDAVLKSLIAASMDAFITLHIFDLESEDWNQAAVQIRTEFNNAKELLQPLLDVKALEQEDDICPWAIQSQVLLSTLVEEDLLKLEVNDTNVFDELFPFNEPTVNGTEMGITINTISAVDAFEQEPGLDTAAQVAIKMIDQETLKELNRDLDLGLTFADPISCKDINKAAMDRARELASRSARERFDAKEVTIVLDEDIPYNEYTVFLSSEIVFDFEDNVLTVQSPTFSEEYKECKLLSPARAMEFIAVDSHR